MWLGHHFQGQKVKGQGHRGAGAYCGGLPHSLLCGKAELCYNAAVMAFSSKTDSSGNMELNHTLSNEEGFSSQNKTVRTSVCIVRHSGSDRETLHWIDMVVLYSTLTTVSQFNVHRVSEKSRPLLLHCALASCGAVYCNRSCLWVCVCVCVFVGVFVCGSVTTIIRNYVHPSSPNWVCG